MGLAFSVTIRCDRIGARKGWKQGEPFAALQTCCLDTARNGLPAWPRRDPLSRWPKFSPSPPLSRNCPLRDFCCLTAKGNSFNPHHGFITTLSGDPGCIIYWRYISICNEAVGGKYKPTNKKQTHTTLLSYFLPLLAGPGYALHTKGAQHLTGHCRRHIRGLPGELKKNSDHWSNKKTSLRWLRAFISYILQIIHYWKILIP